MLPLPARACTPSLSVSMAAPLVVVIALGRPEDPLAEPPIRRQPNGFLEGLLENFQLSFS